MSSALVWLLGLVGTLLLVVAVWAWFVQRMSDVRTAFHRGQINALDRDRRMGLLFWLSVLLPLVIAVVSISLIANAT